MKVWLSLVGAIAAAAAMVLTVSVSQAVLIREVRATQAELKGFGYVEIAKQKWCLVSAEAEMMEATSGRPMGETYFGSSDPDICQVMWKAAQLNARVDLSAIPEKAVVDPLFIGSVKKIYIVGYIWVRFR
jgi:hypothetical protein